MTWSGTRGHSRKCRRLHADVRNVRRCLRQIVLSGKRLGR